MRPVILRRDTEGSVASRAGLRGYGSFVVCATQDDKLNGDELRQAKMAGFIADLKKIRDAVGALSS